MQLDVISPARNGLYPGIKPLVSASDVLNLLRVSHQVYEEAHRIFWSENAFIFPDQDTMHSFLHRISTESFALIRTLGIEKTVNAECINLENGAVDLGYWFADVRIPPFLQPLHLDGWETKFEDYVCLRDHWVPDYSNPLELKIRKFKIHCKTTYNLLTWPLTGEVERTKETSSGTADTSIEICAMKNSLSRRPFILPVAQRELL